MSALAQVNVLEPEVALSDARAIFTDGVAGRSDEASTMGCGGQDQAFGQQPAETAGLDTEIAPNAMGSESNVGGDGNAFEQPESGVRANGARADEYHSAAADADDDNFDARTCDICKLPNAPESFLLCDECNKGYHTYCDAACPPLRSPGTMGVSTML